MHEGGVVQRSQRRRDVGEHAQQPLGAQPWHLLHQLQRRLAVDEILHEKRRLRALVAPQIVRADQAGNIQPPQQRKFSGQGRRIERARLPQLGHQPSFGGFAVGDAEHDTLRAAPQHRTCRIACVMQERGRKRGVAHAVIRRWRSPCWRS